MKKIKQINKKILISIIVLISILLIGFIGFKSSSAYATNDEEEKNIEDTLETIKQKTEETINETLSDPDLAIQGKTIEEIKAEINSNLGDIPWSYEQKKLIDDKVLASNPDYFCMQHSYSYYYDNLNINQFAFPDWVKTLIRAVNVLSPNPDRIYADTYKFKGIKYPTDLITGLIGLKQQLTFSGSADAGWGGYTASGNVLPKYGTIAKSGSTTWDYKAATGVYAFTGVRWAFSSFYYYKVPAPLGWNSLSGDKTRIVKSAKNLLDALNYQELDDGGMAFAMATYKQTTEERKRTGHADDPLQIAIWDHLGQLGRTASDSHRKNQLSDAMKKYDDYYKKATDKKNNGANIGVTVDDRVGTTLVYNDTTYKVGPFTMSHYLRAEDVEISDPIRGYKNLQEAFNASSTNKMFGTFDVRGTIIKAVAYFDNGTKVEFPVPKPDEKFYIYVPRDKVGDANELVELGFEYQYIEALSTGDYYDGLRHITFWTEANVKDGCKTYYNTCLKLLKWPLTSSKPGPQHCQHYKTKTITIPTPWGPITFTIIVPAGSHNNAIFLCKHGYGWTSSEKCQAFNWKLTGAWPDTLQDAMEAKGWIYNKKYDTYKEGHGEHPNLKIEVHVPLITDIKVEKIIVKVHHNDSEGRYTYGAGISGIGSIFSGIFSSSIGDNTSRFERSMEEKYDDTVKVERGDTVVFRIDIINNSPKYDTKIKLKDTLPDEIEGNYKLPTNIAKSSDMHGITWITVPKQDKVTYYVEVIPSAQTGKYTNTVEITTRNTGTLEHMQYVEWYGHTKGNIVNTNDNRVTDLREKDSDTYEIKQYKVNIDKHIVKVEHTTNGEVTYDALADNDENLKSSQLAIARVKMGRAVNLLDPVYVEYGDRVTYQIDVYNTTPLDYAVTNRSGAPYWKPDKVYVDLLDELPNHSDIKINITNDGNVLSQSGLPIVLPVGNILSISNLCVPAGSVTTITVSFVVEDVQAGKLCPNVVEMVGEVYNINHWKNLQKYDRPVYNTEKSEAYNPITNRQWLVNADYYKLNDYKLDIDKYISSYDGLMMKDNNSKNFTHNETSSINEDESIERMDRTDEEKSVSPFQAEKTETLTYSIRLENLSEKESGLKPATKVRTTDITETLQEGLAFQSVTAKIYKPDGTARLDDVPVTVTPKGNNVYLLSIPNKVGEEYTTLNPGEYIIYYVKVKITESNMYLYNLENKAEITTLTNINDVNRNRIVTEQNKYPIKKSSEFVKLKDLVIAGKVWLDQNKDGYMTNDENKFENIIVHLYNAKNDQIVETVRTDATGLYTFERVYKATTKVDGSNVEGTIEEEPNKKNYKQGTELNSYYVEFEYDGLMYKSTEIYSNDSHIDENWLPVTDSGNYINDSNAFEFKDVREEFNRHFETIGYNKGYYVGEDKNSNTGTKKIEYNKENHTSTFLEDRSRVMTSRSFVLTKGENISSGTANNTKSLWLYPLSTANYQLAETEYLKYINLGLEEREDVDISITKDVYQVKTTINGEEVIYDYNQEEVNDEYKNDYVIKKPYNLEFYESDFKYRYEQYKNEKVREYKGTESELNVEVTFKIAITNEKITDDEPYRQNKDIPIEVTIDELADYYDENFIKYTGEENNTLTVKTKNGDYLKDKQIKIAEAWYKSSETSNESMPLTLSNTSNYNRERDFTANGYNTLYIRGFDNVKLKEGETGYVFVKYVLDKDSTRTLKIEDSKSDNMGIEGISEINAYSTWYGDVSDEYKQENPAYEVGYPAGLVDKDSNPGNIGDDNGLSTLQEPVGTKSADDTDLYEDDTYKTGIKMNVKTITDVPTPTTGINKNVPSIETYRILTGFMWDDSRSEAIGTDGNVQYSGNGIYIETDTKHTEAKSNSNVLELLNRDSGYKSIVERFNNPTSEQNDFVVKGAKAQLIEIVKIPANENNPSEEGTKYYEEVIDANWTTIQETRTNENGKYVLSGFIPGYYTVRFTYGDQTTNEMLTFNGQDYKSTKYTTGVDNYTYKPEDGETELNVEKIKKYDEIMTALEQEDKSDARDDELDRLNAISYSEIMTNEKAETLKGISIPSTTEEDRADKTAREEKLVNATKMNSETVTFYVKPEKLDDYTANVTYATCTNIPYNKISGKTYNVKNIDFGIEYRPESKISLNKEIKEIKLVTSDQNTLIKIAFKDVEVNGNKVLNEVTGRIEREVDTEKSIGLNNLQFICNNNTLQGFAYINVDNVILQGCRINVDYEFTVENRSEVDRISTNLDSLRYKQNSTNAIATNSELRTQFVSENDYLGSETAMKRQYELTYKKDTNYATDDKYRIIEKTMTTGDDNYYGKYLGSTYFLSTITPKDTIVDLKVDKILDYIDTDLTFPAEKNKDVDNAWTTTTADALRTGDGYNGGLLKRSLFSNIETSSSSNRMDQLIDLKGVSFETGLTSNLAISMDDRISDDQREDEVVNGKLSKFLEPKTPVTTENQYSGYVVLTTEKLISSETDTDNLRFENLAEVIQFTTTAGRRTNFSTTIGNANIKSTRGEYIESLNEPDTSATEVITLTPPTGLDRRIQNMVLDAVDKNIDKVIIVIISLVCLTGAILLVPVAVRKYKNRPIK